MMSDVTKHIENRSPRDDEFADGLAHGYADFKIGVMLREARLAAGLTQEQVASKLRTQKSAISRIENHADDVRLSTLRRYADAVGASLHIRIA
jgi:HTH-type transcriptional regulator/antitoxin HipB